MLTSKKSAIPGLLAFIGFVLVVVSPYARSIDDAYITLSFYIGIPLLLIASVYAVLYWWATQIQGGPPPTSATKWKRIESRLEWLNWF